MFQPVSPKPDFPAQERDILRRWRETDAFGKLRRLRAGGPTFSFLDGPITANNPMGVHHAWGRTYKDLWQRYKAMQGYDQRWQNGFDCQGLWVEVNVEKDLGFQTKKDIEDYGLASFVSLCKQRVLNFAAVQTEQSIRLGMWMDWNDPDQLRWLAEKLAEDPNQVITLPGPNGPVTGAAEALVGRLGLPELGGSYFTFSDENNYQIWAFLKRCAERGWVYRGTDVMPWCARCGTGISEHEISTEDYPDLTHPGLTVRLPLRERPGEYLLVWTTTPWTLTSNVAAAVGPDLTYLKVRQGDAVYYLSEGARRILTGDYEEVGRLPGAAMEGWTYDGPFDDLPAQQAAGGHVAPELRGHIHQTQASAAEAHRIILWREVSHAEGAGIVHIAPGCGAEDFQLGRESGLPVVAPLDENGVFMDGFGRFSGLSVSEATQPIIEDLRRKGLFYRLDEYTHHYPTCWRCKTELVFRLVDEWFISMGPTYDKPREQLTPEEKSRSLRYQIMDVVDQIRWIPGFGYDREMDWLRNMHDWMISKKRYWGLALPVWACSDCGHFDVIGSRDELEERAVEGWSEFDGHTPHRPFIDAVKIACSHCGAKTSRIPDVGNPWLDAGIVSFSTLGYRQDRAFWQKWFPADFITESFPGQFRNWFYSLLAMSTVLEYRPPFNTALGYATLLAEDGRPMHKSLGNMIEFNEAAENVGVDVMRWMFAAQRYEANMLFGYHHADESRRRFLLPLWNVYSFFVTYANLDRWKPSARRRRPTANPLDVWVLSRLREVVADVAAALEGYDAPRATRAVEPFLDDLSNWYLRRSRRRFWKTEADADKQAAYATLYEVLVTLTKLLAPFVPFVSEAMYQNLVRSVDAAAPESVHHCEWPKPDAARVDSDSLADMAVARQVVALGHALRASGDLRLRQPLSQVVVVVEPARRAALDRLKRLVMDELNVKSLAYAENEAELVNYQIRPHFEAVAQKVRELFPDPGDPNDRVGQKAARDKRKQFTGKVHRAIAALNPDEAAVGVRAGQTIALNIDGLKFGLAPGDLLVQYRPKTGFAVASEGNLVVALDTALTPELEAEGLAREFVRRVQELRKTAGLEISDRIRIYYAATPRLAAAVGAHRAYIMNETLSQALKAGPPPDGAATAAEAFDGESVTLGVVRVRVPARAAKSRARPAARRAAKSAAKRKAAPRRRTKRRA